MNPTPMSAADVQKLEEKVKNLEEIAKSKPSDNKELIHTINVLANLKEILHKAAEEQEALEKEN